MHSAIIFYYSFKVKKPIIWVYVWEIGETSLYVQKILIFLGFYIIDAAQYLYIRNSH